MVNKIKIINKKNETCGDFNFDLSNVGIREDIFKKIVVIENSWFRQSHGAKPLAGKRHSINLTRRRSVFRSTYGKGQSRVPRKSMSRKGMQIRMVGAFAPGCVGGRKAHPPKVHDHTKGINKKEWFMGLKIGLSAAFDKNLITENGQKIPSNYPFLIKDDIEEISTTKEIVKLLTSFGFKDEIDRCSKTKIRAGIGTMRNRRYQNKRGPLFILSDMDKPLAKGLNNIKGFEVLTSEDLMVKDFGMSYKPGRCVIFSEKALSSLIEFIKGGKE